MITSTSNVSRVSSGIFSGSEMSSNCTSGAGSASPPTSNTSSGSRPTVRLPLRATSPDRRIVPSAACLLLGMERDVPGIIRADKQRLYVLHSARNQRFNDLLE